MRIPFPLLRQTAWLLTAATIAFNGAASWPDPLGTAMHAVIPVLFVVSGMGGVASDSVFRAMGVMNVSAGQLGGVNEGGPLAVAV